jgi:hypothetical protein
MIEDVERFDPERQVMLGVDVDVFVHPDIPVPILWLSTSRYSRRSARVQGPAMLDGRLRAGHSPPGNATPAVEAHYTSDRLQAI